MNDQTELESEIREWLEEIRRWQTNDPIGKFEKVLLEAGVVQAEIDRLEAQAEADIADAVQFAEASPFPALDEIWTDIYVEN